MLEKTYIPLEEAVLHEKGLLPVMEYFYTLQGEGAWTGTASYFIRLAGCDVGCHWCDVKESWTVQEDQYMSCEDLLAKVRESGTHHVVITGGEPTLYDLTPLVDLLHAHGLQVHIETAGTNPLKGAIDWVCLSPKKFKQPVSEIYPLVDELKVVIFNKHDFIWAEKHAALCPEKTQLFLQPEWSKMEKMMPAILAYIAEHPRWRLSLQTHKWIQIP
ncbi:MAG: 7-carboxy-7-deazaguanine synthase QueE [Bacteroidota bacterium]